MMFVLKPGAENGVSFQDGNSFTLFDNFPDDPKNPESPAKLDAYKKALRSGETFMVNPGDTVAAITVHGDDIEVELPDGQIESLQDGDTAFFMAGSSSVFQNSDGSTQLTCIWLSSF